MADTLQIARQLLAGALSDGGATVSPAGDSLPDYGFMVGGLVPEWSAPADILTIRRVRDFVNTYATRQWLGSWVEGDRIVFDVSEWHADRLSALVAARARGEREVYDIARGESIPA